jgi:hypothetical protein
MQLLKAEIQNHGGLEFLAALILDDEGNMGVVAVNLNRPEGAVVQGDGTVITVQSAVEPAHNWRAAVVQSIAEANPVSDSPAPGAGEGAGE